MFLPKTEIPKALFFLHPLDSLYKVIKSMFSWFKLARPGVTNFTLSFTGKSTFILDVYHYLEVLYKVIFNNVTVDPAMTFVI